MRILKLAKIESRRGSVDIKQICQLKRYSPGWKNRPSRVSLLVIRFSSTSPSSTFRTIFSHQIFFGAFWVEAKTDRSYYLSDLDKLTLFRFADIRKLCNPDLQRKSGTTDDDDDDKIERITTLARHHGWENLYTVSQTGLLEDFTPL